MDLDLAFARPAFLALRGLWFVAQMYPRLEHRERFGTNVAGNITRGLETSLEQVGEAEQARNRLWRTCADLFTRADLIVTPCMAVGRFVDRDTTYRRVVVRASEQPRRRSMRRQVRCEYPCCP
jgi:Asp-tRNA(Asn)/Glu-tRNA(Gln) amidotransferase A subunit family amidase